MTRVSVSIAAVLLLSLSVFFGACEDRSDRDRADNRSTADVRDRDDNTTDRLKRVKSDYENRIEAQLETFDDRLDKFRSADNDNTSHKRVVNELAMKTESAKKMLAEIKSADEDTWQRMQDDMDNAVSDLNKSFSSNNVPTVAVRDRDDNWRNNDDRADDRVDDRREEMRDRAEDRADNRAEARDQARDRYLTVVSNRLDAFEDRLDQIKDKITDRNVELKRTYHFLTMKYDAARAEYNHLKDADNDVWSSLRNEMDNTISDLQDDFSSKGYSVASLDRDRRRDD